MMASWVRKHIGICLGLCTGQARGTHMNSDKGMMWFLNS